MIMFYLSYSSHKTVVLVVIDIKNLSRMVVFLFVRHAMHIFLCDFLGVGPCAYEES